MSALEKTRYTPEQYLEMERKADFKSEYLHGEIIAMAGGSPDHSLITMNIGGTVHGQLKGGPCRAFSSDLRVHIRASGLYTYADVAVVCGELALSSSSKDNLLNPTVIFEVLSPSTQDYDRGEKFAYYRTLESLRDYVLIAQDKYLVEHYSLDTNGHWLPNIVRRREESIAIASINCTLALSDIYDGVTIEESTLRLVE